MLNPLQPFFYLLLYLGVLYIRPHEYVPLLMNRPVLPLLLMTAFVIWLVRQPKSFEAPQFWVMPVLALMLALSIVFSGWVGGGIQVLSDFIPVVMLFYIVATSVDSLRRLRQIFMVLAAAATVIAWHGIDQSRQGIGWTGAELSQGTRITYLGFLNDPNDLAMALIMVLPMPIYLARRASYLLRPVWYGATAAVLYAIYLTNSRGAFLALAAMVGLYAVLRYGPIKSLMLLPLLILPLAALGPSRISNMSSDEASAEGRVEAWYEGVHLLLSSPLFGVGKGLFADHHGLTAHNSFVLAFAELGLVGYFFWLSNLVVSWLMLQRLVRTPAPPPPAGTDTQAAPQWTELQAAARTLWYGYCGGLAAAFFLSRSYVVILYLHIALIVAVFQMARVERPDFPALPMKPLVVRLALLSVCSIFGLWLLTRVLL